MEEIATPMTAVGPVPNLHKKVVKPAKKGASRKGEYASSDHGD